MKQTKPFPLTLVSSKRILLAGYITAVISVLLIIVAQYYFTSTPTFVYALELILLGSMLGYGFGVFHYYLKWYSQSRKIKKLLGLPRRPNGRFTAITIDEAHLQYTEIERQYDESKQILEVVEDTGVLKEDKPSICDRLAKREIDAAWCALSEAIQRKIIYDRAKSAHCLLLVRERFRSESFDSDEAELLISAATRLQEQAEKYGIKDEVITMLEFGNIEKARSMVDDIRSQNISTAQVLGELKAANL